MKKVYLIAVVFALVAGFATYMFAQGINEKTTIKDADTKKVYVALQDIPKDTEITEDMFADGANYFAKKEVVNDYLVPNYVENSKDLIGKITVDPIYKSEQVNGARLVDKDDQSVSLSFKLDPGKVAYSLDASSVSGVDGYIAAGDTVDVIVNEQKSGKVKATVAYKGLKIIRVSGASSQTADGTPITTYSSLTVEVTEKQAVNLYEIENNYSYKLVLNARK